MEFYKNVEENDTKEESDSNENSLSKSKVKRETSEIPLTEQDEFLIKNSNAIMTFTNKSI